jgi:hypothetical protein
MAPQSLSQFRASVSSSAEVTLATPNDQTDMVDRECSTVSFKYLDHTWSLPHRPTYAFTNRIPSLPREYLCSTTTTLTKTTTVTTQVPHVETFHPQSGNRRIVDGKYTYRCVCSSKGKHTTLVTKNSQRTDRLCPAHSMMPGTQKDDVVEEGTRVVADVVPGIPNPSVKTKPSVTKGKLPKTVGDGDHHQEITMKAPNSPKNFLSDAPTPSSISIVLPTSSTASSTADLLAHSQEPSRPFTALPASTTSNYPRPSPPIFLYPTPIVPHQEYHHRQYQHNHLHRPKPSAETFTAFAPTLLAYMDYTYTYIPLFYKLLLYTLIALGFFWAILVYYINFPSAFPLNLMKRKTKSERKEMKRLREEQAAGTFMGELSSSKRKREEAERDAEVNGEWRFGAWGRWLGPRKEKEKPKPIDKADKYAHLRSSSTSTNSSQGPSTGISISTATTPQPHCRETGGSGTDERGLQLKQRTPHASAYPAEHRRPISTGAEIAISHEQQSHTASTQAQTPLSPANPFLPLVLRPRQSSEWLHEHSRFFSSAHLPTASNHSRSTSSGMSYEDVDAMEAQTPLITTHLGNKKDGGVKKVSGREGSWLDMVDGAVNRAVGRVARWTDGDGEEGLLLPVANE